MRKLLLPVIILCAMTFLCIAAIAQEPAYKLAYNYQPRYFAPVAVPGREIVPDGSNLQGWYDTGRPDYFTESDLVLDDLAGKTKTIGTCTTDNKVICAVHDGEPSPDGKYILYTKAVGTEWYGKEFLPFGAFYAHHYEIWIHEIATGKDTLIDSNARMGKWAGHGRIVFTSNRAGTYVPYALTNPVFQNKGTHVFSAKLDLATMKLSDVFDLMPHTVQCMSPVTMLDGNVMASCWNGFGNRAYGHTPQNLAWGEEVRGNGTEHSVKGGAHSANGQPYWRTREFLLGIVDPNRAGEGGSATKVLRGHVPLPDPERYLVVVYYRTNHQGNNGIILNCRRSKVEGYSKAINVKGITTVATHPGSAQFVPDCYAVTPFAQDQDAPPRYHKNGKAMGKAGDPFAVPASVGKFGYTRCRGQCYEPTPAQDSNIGFTGGEPVSKREIHIAKVDMVIDPFSTAQTECIAGCDLSVNAWGARWISPFAEIYGQAEPAKAPPRLANNGLTFLHIVNARAGELDRLRGPDVHEWDHCNTQGCADLDWVTTITAIRITEILPCMTPVTKPGLCGTGEVRDFPLEPDGSVAAILRCGQTYQTSGINALGKEVAKDNSLHYAVCGETVTCHGCHDAHSEERNAEINKTAAERFIGTDAHKKIPAGC